MRSIIGLILSCLYIAISAYLILSQGLFGESFIAILLGLPWSLIPSFFEFGNVSGAMIYMLIFLPLVLNAALLYGIGSFIGRAFFSNKGI